MGVNIMDGTLLASQGSLTLVVPLVILMMAVVYGIFRYRLNRSKNESRKEQEVRKIFY
jgi:hypothetical protein